MSKSTLSPIEQELLAKSPEPKVIKRSDYGYKLNYQLSNKLSETLNKIKGRIDEEIGETGDLDMNEYIDFKINRKMGFTNNFDIFSETIEINGLDVYFLIDCSGSMRGLGQKMADITATIMHSMKNCPFINFKTIAFSAFGNKYQGVNDYINDYTEAGRVHADTTYYHDIQSLAIDQARIKLSDSENKKLIILLTDGYPECGDYRISHEVLQSLWERSVTKAENEGIELFCMYYGHIGSTMTLMRKIFGNNIYETNNFEDIQEKLIDKLKLAVANLNNGAKN
jgi:nitric oxide reductase activation protein